MAIPATWSGEKRMYEKQYYAVLHKKTKIIDIPPEEGELGYTTADGNIHEAYDHPIMDGLTDLQRILFRCGVFVHETLHQIFTSFSYLSEVLDKHSDFAEKKVTSLFANLVEDPAIEFFAPGIFGGEMLAALKFSIQHIYKMSPNLSESKTSFTQLINALVMFGDMGLLKGHFTYPEAEECFLKIAPEFNEMVECTDPHARIDAAERWMVLTRPLWKKEMEEQENFEQMIQQLIDELMNGGMEGTGEALENPIKGLSDARSKRRKAFAKAITDQEETTESSDSNTKNCLNSDDNECPGKCISASNDNSENKLEEYKKKTIYNFQDEGVTEEYSESAAEELWKQIKKETQQILNDTENILDITVELPKSTEKEQFQRLTCLNRRVESGNASYYAEIVSKNARDIKMLTKSLRDLFRADYDDYLRTTSGKYALKRDLDHTTVKIFDKRKEKKNIDDMAVMLLVDSSGSMHGKKIELARETTIILAETFAALNIPCYIMGFTADTYGADVIHEHFVSWHNTSSERTSLVHLNASVNNDDGYSIRYATQILKKKRAEHNILFVISDGAPACNRYRYTSGVTDTAMAIRDAKKVSDIFGIGIEMHQCDELKKMYGGAYVDVTDINGLKCSLSKQLKRVIRAWL